MITLYFGKNDKFKPDDNWFDNLDLKENLFPNENHEFYQKKEVAATICNQIIEQLNPKQ